jgi:hypothetical protein
MHLDHNICQVLLVLAQLCSEKLLPQSSIPQVNVDSLAQGLAP